MANSKSRSCGCLPPTHAVAAGVTIISCGLAGVATVTIMAGLHLQGMLSLKKVPAVAMS